MTRTVIATLLCLLPALGRADFTARDSTGETITFDSTETSSVHTTHHVITDGAGTRQGTTSAPIHVGDAGGSLTVDGSLTCTDGGSTISVDDGAGALTVDGTVAVSSVAGSVTVADGGGSLTVDGSLTCSDGGSSLTVDGTVTVVGAAAAGAAASGNPVLVAGQTIGGDVQPLNVDMSGYLQTVGIGGAGTPNGGVMSVQGVSGGEDVPVSVSSVAAPSSIYHGQTTVTTAGTEVTLGSSQALTQGCWVKALAANTGFIYVGANPVTSSTGYQLDALESIFVPIANRTTIYIDSSVNGEGAAYICN